MKSEKGITLLSLIIYVIVMLIVVTIIGTITSYFYANINEQYEESKIQDNETTFDMYFKNDIKEKIVYVKDTSFEDVELDKELDTIILMYEEGTSVFYTIKDTGIYRNSVKIYNKDENVNIKFKLYNIDSKAGNIVVNQKRKLDIIKDGNVFKSYTINLELRGPTPTPA